MHVERANLVASLWDVSPIVTVVTRTKGSVHFGDKVGLRNVLLPWETMNLTEAPASQR